MDMQNKAKKLIEMIQTKTGGVEAVGGSGESIKRKTFDKERAN